MTLKFNRYYSVGIVLMILFFINIINVSAINYIDWNNNITNNLDLSINAHTNQSIYFNFTSSEAPFWVAWDINTEPTIWSHESGTMYNYTRSFQNNSVNTISVYIFNATNQSLDSPLIWTITVTETPISIQTSILLHLIPLAIIIFILISILRITEENFVFGFLAIAVLIIITGAYMQEILTIISGV